MKQLFLLFPMVACCYTTHAQQHSYLGSKVNGNFNGDGKIAQATVVKTKEGQGNPVEDGTPDEYEIRFPGTGLSPIAAGCCTVRLVNEGDLDGDGADELSLFQAPMNGCTYSMKTYTLKQGKWQLLVPTFLIPTACEPLSDTKLRQRIFAEQGNIYYLETDINDKHGKLTKRKVATRQIKK
ncbi:hypothetical protein [Taibaiella koreensis]|uniref:hypothetical protein n=1 Tax=Taibaiella koreensis TaxID=1268548 RepID=UPI0013C3048D|nr:hypothetical protein [Taibaiella koreensis]